MNVNTIHTATFAFDGIQGRVDASGYVFGFDGWSFHKDAIRTPELLAAVEAAQAEACNGRK